MAPSWRRWLKLKLQIGVMLARENSREKVNIVVTGCSAGKLVQIGAKPTRHSKYIVLQLSDVAVPRRLFAAFLDRIAWLAIPPPTVCNLRKLPDERNGQ